MAKVPVGKHVNSLRNLEKGRAGPTRRRYSYAVLAQMTKRMMAGKFTVTMVARALGVSKGSANRWVNAMHEAGNIHVVEWVRTLNYRIGGRIYAWGPGDDVPRPLAMTPTILQRRTRRKARSLDGWKPVPSTEEQYGA